MHGDFLTLSIFLVVSSVTPGPNNFMLLHGGLRRGFWACKQHMLGISGGATVMAFFAYWGMAELIVRWPTFMTGLKIIGSAYLLWLARGMWVSGIVPSDDKIDHVEQSAGWQLPLNLWQAALFQWVNPKCWLMIAMMPSLLLFAGSTPAIDNWPVYIVLFLINISCISVWAAGGNTLRRLLHREKLMHFIHIVIVTATVYCAASMWR